MHRAPDWAPCAVFRSEGAGRLSGACAGCDCCRRHPRGLAGQLVRQGDARCTVHRIGRPAPSSDLKALAAYPEPAPVVIVADGTRAAWPANSFARVMLDAPCTGLGALRRRPEARWRRQPSDLDALVPLQHALLRSAIAAARPGGVIAC